jgi:hypothetical protein
VYLAHTKIPFYQVNPHLHFAWPSIDPPNPMSIVVQWMIPKTLAYCYPSQPVEGVMTIPTLTTASFGHKKPSHSQKSRVRSSIIGIEI